MFLPAPMRDVLMSFPAGVDRDYLAEMNLAANAVAMAAGAHPGYETTAWEGISQSLKVIAEKKIKVIINGGALRPKALAQKTAEAVSLS